MEFLRQHQLNIMLFLSGICSILAILSFFTRSMPKKRRFALMMMQFYASLLLFMDRLAYIYRGNISVSGFWIVRISNFFVYLLSLCIIHAFNLYLVDLFTHEGQLVKRPFRFIISEILFGAGIFCLIISQFTGLYYTFDEMNRYQRASGFLISYFFPFVIMTLQLSVIIQYYKRIVRNIRIPLLLFSFIPFIATIFQFFTYGLSLQNIAMVGDVALLYVFVLLDMNKTVERANKIEVDFLKEEQKNMRIMFEQTARALANAIDAKDQYTHGHSVRVAEYAQKIAILYGKDEKFCSDIYYAGLLHDVGKIGVSSSIINKSGRLSDEEFTEIKKHPVIGQQILSSISKSPYLSIAAKYHHEHYDGRGYPEHLKGDDIPEIARIIAVADAYDAMTSKRSYRDPIPQQKVREEIVKGMGSQFDPQFATIMLHLIDYDTEYILKESEESISLFGKNEMHCEGYRSSVSEGLHLLQNITKIHIMCKADEKTVSEKTVPSFILFDSLDTRVHETESKRKEMFYLEYASICFNGETDCSAARKIKVEVLKASENDISMLLAEYKKGINYEIEAVKVKDHILIKISNKFQILQFIIALPDSSRYCYLAFTGEHCVLSNLAVEQMDSNVAPDFIPRIANEISFITGPTGDIPSIQIDDWRSAATEGIPVKDGMEISFHTMSLPTARLIWHCPFICLFYSDDKKVNGRNFKEFVLIRFDGENWEAEGYSKNTILINKNDSFEGWEYWKERNKKGMDCKVTINREGKRITVFTENCGIAIKSISLLAEELPEVYVALTGDQCVLTNIKVK